MFNRFTDQAKNAVIEAQREARELRNPWIGTEHLLLALLREPEAPGAATLSRLGVTADSCRETIATLPGTGGEVLDEQDGEALRAFGIDLDEVRRRTEETFGPGALDAAPADPDDHETRRLGRRRRRSGERPRGHIPFTRAAKKALELSLREAVALKDRDVGSEHILLGVLRSDDDTTAALLQKLDLARDDVRSAVMADRRDAA
ncbi:ClpA/ClpB-like protein [Haloactinopolyspora alba]|uniref:ClpA/ClpB-like protein n=1 Tax=Haloactinopolyspora alba TaxID=648780 RepID=A0A2P8E9D4_9ACTN|nr:Clp protease N-terminal domain-containing protein [Haloactinopolyspora alba]PSL06027.1 ClpA/ClpB-like protein [Haloactinopolyspora alba]